jgi:mono/diheme cytochrome c family protein
MKLLGRGTGELRLPMCPLDAAGEAKVLAVRLPAIICLAADWHVFVLFESTGRMSAVANQPKDVERSTEAPAVERGLSRFHLGAIAAAPLVLAAIAWAVVPTGVFFGLHTPPQPPTVALGSDRQPDGALLYRQHCAYCHGERGDGNGIAALSPRARYFGHERFKLAATTNGVPSDDDLIRVIRHGIHGTAMPGFDEKTLTPDELNALCAHVRRLTWAGTYERIRQKTDPDEFDPTECAEKSDTQCKPGPPLVLPATMPAATPESIARGRKVYEQTCMACHGPNGRGDGTQVNDPAFKNENGTPARPRDLTSGIFKGGGDPDRLYLRIRLGMPGTPMPANPSVIMPDESVFDLIHYVRSLSDPHVVPTERLTAR